MGRRSVLDKAQKRVTAAVAAFESAASEIEAANRVLDDHATALNEAITCLVDERDAALSAVHSNAALAARLREFTL